MEQEQKDRPADRTTMQIAMSVEDKAALKTAAAQRGTTVAALVHEWVEGMITPNTMDQDNN